MMDHYFSPTHSTPHNIVRITVAYAGRPMQFDTDSGVFSKGKMDRGTEILLDALPSFGDRRILDLGCGWGAIGVILAALNPEASIHMSDVNERAVQLARRNAKRNRVKVQTYLSDKLEDVEGPFDVIVTNPPIRAGKETIYAMIRQSHEKLSPNGEFYAVVRTKQGAKSYMAELIDIFGENVEIIKRGSGYKVFRAEKK